MSEQDLFWIVENGEARLASPEDEWDGENSVAVIASTERDALSLAARYDQGEIGWDNHVWEGEIVVAVKA